MNGCAIDFLRSRIAAYLDEAGTGLWIFPDPQRQELQARRKFAGRTVHWVTSEIDAGPIVAQAVVSIPDNEQEADLSARILDANTGSAH